MTDPTAQRRRPARDRWMLAFWAVLPALLAAVPGGALGAEPRLESHDRIRAAAAAEAERLAQRLAPADARVEVEVGALDPRLRLAACPQDPESSPPAVPQLRSRLSIGVRCAGTGGWSLYVPVRIRAFAKVVVLAAPAARGEPLAEDRLALEARDIAAMNGSYLTRLQDAEGMVLRRDLGAGAVLAASALEPVKLVRRGQRVRLIAGGTGFAVVTQGEALGDAAAGDLVQVRNLRSHQIVEGQVDSDGRVRVGI